MSALAIARQLLITDAAVTGLVGTRVYPVAGEQGAVRPMVVLHLIHTKDHPTIAGAGKYYNTRFQTDCLGSTATEALNLGEAVIGRLNGIVKIGMTIQGTRYKDIDCLLSETDFTEREDLPDSFRRIIQFSLWWRLR